MTAVAPAAPVATSLPPTHAPSRADLLAIAAAALLLRVAVFAAISLVYQLSPAEYANLYDGRSYLIVARAMEGDRAQFDDYHGRVFPGFPAAVALLHRLGLPLPAAALGLDWFCAALAAALSAALFADRRIGWAMTFFIPHYLMNSTMAMTEAPLLALMCAGLLVGRRRPLAGGALLGLGGLVRPMACFAVLGFAWAAVRRRQWRHAISLPLCAGLVVLGGFALLQWWRGDALACFRYQASSHAAYDGQLLTWPLRSLILTPLHSATPPARVIYIWLHAALALLACARVFGRQSDSRHDTRLAAMEGPWLIGNTLFALCIGNVWGFECFHRFTVPALPAMLWYLRTWLPGRRWVWWGAGAACAVVAVVSAGHGR